MANFEIIRALWKVNFNISSTVETNLLSSRKMSIMEKKERKTFLLTNPLSQGNEMNVRCLRADPPRL
jgi:hypothetical protein